MYVIAFARFAGGGIWLCQESLRHILASPGTIAVTWTERGFNAGPSLRSMCPSIFNRFPVIQPVSSKVRHFSTFFGHLASPGYAPGTIAINVTRLERGFNACKMPRCIPIYLQPFLRYNKLLVENCDIFDTLPLFSAPAGGDSVGIS